MEKNKTKNTTNTTNQQDHLLEFFKKESVPEHLVNLFLFMKLNRLEELSEFEENEVDDLQNEIKSGNYISQSDKDSFLM
jgi:hypothetical protein